MTLRAPVVALFALLALPHGAAAQNATFDCVELLRATSIRPLGTEEPLLRLDLRDINPASVNTRDPISALEGIGDGGAALIAQSPALSLVDGQGLACHLTVVQFTANLVDGRYEVVKWLEQDRERPAGWRAPILLVALGESTAEVTQYAQNWAGQRHDLPVSASKPAENRIVTLLPSAFRQLRAIGGGRQPSGAGFVDLSDLPEQISNDLQDFMINSGALNFKTAPVLCGPADCKTVMELVNNAETSFEASVTPVTQPPTVDTPNVLPSVAEPEITDRSGDPTIPPTSTPGTVPEAAQTNSPSPIPEAEQAHATSPAHYDLAITYRDSAGIDQGGAGFADVGGLACVLLALGADVFIDPPECGSNAFSQLAGSGSLIALNGATDASAWQVVAGAGLRVERLAVELPPGQGIEGCTIEVVIGNARVPLGPIPGSTPWRYEAALDGHLPPARQVAFQIVPSGQAACGGPAREVVVPAAPTVTVPLLARPRARAAITYVVLSQRQELAERLGLDADDRRALMRAILGGIEGAHARLAAARIDAPIALVGAEVVVMDPDNALRSILRLRPEEMRGRAADVFSAVGAESIATLADATPALSAGRISAALASHATATDAGLARRAFVLVAPVPIEADVCGDSRYRGLTDSLGPGTEVLALPLVPLRPGDRPDLSALAPTAAPLAGSPSLPGGAYNCLDLDGGLAVAPFFVEPWRAPAEVPARYATALADRLAPLLLDLASGGSE